MSLIVVDCKEHWGFGLIFLSFLVSLFFVHRESFKSARVVIFWSGRWCWLLVQVTLSHKKKVWGNQIFYFNEFSHLVCISGLSVKLTFKTSKKLDFVDIYQFPFCNFSLIQANPWYYSKMRSACPTHLFFSENRNWRQLKMPSLNFRTRNKVQIRWCWSEMWNSPQSTPAHLHPDICTHANACWCACAPMHMHTHASLGFTGLEASSH